MKPGTQIPFTMLVKLGPRKYSRIPSDPARGRGRTAPGPDDDVPWSHFAVHLLARGNVDRKVATPATMTRAELEYVARVLLRHLASPRKENSA